MMLRAMQGTGVRTAEVVAAYGELARKKGAALSADLARKPYDRARLDVIAGAALREAPALDAGCGAGDLAGYLADSGLAVVGIDLCPDMTEIARVGRRDVDLYTMDLRSQAFGDRAFGALVAHFSLIHIARDGVPAALRELARVLLPGAPILIALFEGEGQAVLPILDGSEDAPRLRVNVYRRQELREHLEASGLYTRVRVEGRRPYPFETPCPRIYATAQRAT